MEAGVRFRRAPRSDVAAVETRVIERASAEAARASSGALSGLGGKVMVGGAPGESLCIEQLPSVTRYETFKRSPFQGMKPLNHGHYLIGAEGLLVPDGVNVEEVFRSVLFLRV